MNNQWRVCFSFSRTFHLSDMQCDYTTYVKKQTIALVEIIIYVGNKICMVLMWICLKPEETKNGKKFIEQNV